MEFSLFFPLFTHLNFCSFLSFSITHSKMTFTSKTCFYFFQSENVNILIYLNRVMILYLQEKIRFSKNESKSQFRLDAHLKYMDLNRQMRPHYQVPCQNACQQIQPEKKRQNIRKKYMF